MTPRVLLVPCPISPLVAFEYFLLKRLGRIGQDAIARYRYRTAGGAKSADVVLGNGAVYNLVGQDPTSYLPSFPPDTPPDAREVLKRLRSYCIYGDTRRGHRLQRWLAKLSLAEESPGAVLETAAKLFEAWCSRGTDPWRPDLEIPELARATPVPRAYPPDKRFGSLPIFKQEEGRVKPGEREVIATANYELAEGLIYELAAAHVGVMVGGPAGSGKSTLVASLAAEMRHQIASLATRRGWEGFSLTVEVVNLDLATPTVDAIAAGVAKRDYDALKNRKRRWTEALALEALDAFLQAKARSNLVLADLPGGPIGAITEIVAAPADAAILITKDWSFMENWQGFARRMGIPTIVQARSRRSVPDQLPFSAELFRLLRRLLGRSRDEEGGFTSVVTRYHPGRIIAGRVVDLDRMERSWDRFVLWTTESMLFNILPARIRERREKLERFLAKQENA